jgi:hypothetical protein
MDDGGGAGRVVGAAPYGCAFAGVGPLFVGGLLFSGAQGLFIGWLRVLVGAMVAAVAALMVLGFELDVAGPQVALLLQDPGGMGRMPWRRGWLRRRACLRH